MNFHNKTLAQEIFSSYLSDSNDILLWVGVRHLPSPCLLRHLCIRFIVLSDIDFYYYLTIFYVSFTV